MLRIPACFSMAKFGVHRIFLLVSLLKFVEGTKLLAEFKKCGDLECETLLSRVIAITDFRGPDCRYLNFTTGEEISVYIKLAGEEEELWAGSKEKDFGYFPRDAVYVEEVFISEEVKIVTKESDFLCIFGENYMFENEDSELNSDSGGNTYSYEEDKDQKSSIYENDFHIEHGFYSTSENILPEHPFLTSEAPDTIISTSGLMDKEEAEAQGTEQTAVSEGDHVPQSSSVPDLKGWFGFGRQQEEGQTLESVTAPLQENSFQSQQIAVEDENDLKELSSSESRAEDKHELESELILVSRKKSELMTEAENSPRSQPTAWFGGGFTNYLGLGGEDTEPELLSQESDPQEDVPHSSGEEATTQGTEIVAEKEDIVSAEIVPGKEDIVSAGVVPGKEDIISNGNSSLKPSWFDFGFGMLAFTYASADKSVSDDGKMRERDEGDGHEHTQNEFNPDGEQETKIINMGNEDQIDKEHVSEKADDSDSLPYLRKFLYNFNNPWNFQNPPKETELLFPGHILDENHATEHEETEAFLDEHHPEDDMKDMASKVLVELSEETHEEDFKNPFSKNYANSKTLLDTEESAQVETDESMENTPVDSQMFSADESLSSQNGLAQKEDASVHQILKYILQIFVYGFMDSAFSSIVVLTERVVEALPEDMRPGPNPYGLPWELVIGATVVGFFAIFLLLWRSFRSVRSRLYVGREKKLAIELSALIEEKCKLLEKLSLAENEGEDLESFLKDASLDESTEAQRLEDVYEKLSMSKSELEDEILSLEKELEEEKSKHSEQDELMVDISKRIQSLEEESKSLKSQVAEAKTTFKIFQMNEERLKVATKNAMSESLQLQESQKQLLQEAEEWKEQVNELNKQKIVLEESKINVEQVLCEKENQIKSLTERLLKMKDWSAVLGEDITDDINLELEMKSESENENHPKGTLQKLIHAAKLNASLKTLEGERNQIYVQLSEVDKTKEELTEYIKDLQAEQTSLQSENTQFESENQKLQQKLKVMTELYQENEMTLHRKLTVEENCRLEKEEKLSKVDEKISYAAEELETYRKRAKDLEEELERTIHSYQGQIISHEKKAHDNWLAARTTERNLNDLRKENAHTRQKLTETELKIELLEKDPYALDPPNTTFGREHSPYGPSPLGRPSSETRAFLSPPTLLEGPLRLSPLLPGGAGRGPRGPGIQMDHQITNERGEPSSRLIDPHRAPSDTGSLSPPWDHDRRMMIPPAGQPYPDPVLPPQRQDRFYPNSGRLSGPSELRSFNMPSFDKSDGPVSSEMESSGNDSKDDRDNLNVPDSSLPVESETVGPGFVPTPFPPVRGPMDVRGLPMRRKSPYPPPPPGTVYGDPRGYFPPRDFAGGLPPPPPFAMRTVYPPRGVPLYLPPRAGIYPTPPHPERSELPSGLIPPSNEPTTAEHQEPQEET